MTRSDRVAGETGKKLAQFQELEDVISNETDAGRRKGLSAELRMLKQQIDAYAAEEQRLRAREAELSGQLAIEQTQWAELNRRLDEFERELGSPRR